MRQTPALLRQHIGWHFTKHWAVQGKRKPIDTGAEKILKEKGISVCDPDDVLKEQKRIYERVEIVGFKEPPEKFDKTHPDWHEQKLLTYKDHNILLEGLTQAKIITKTVELKDGLPDNYQLQTLPKGMNKAAKQIVMNAQILDAEQKRLPKIKDPERPAWNFPRTYGVTQSRRNKLTISKLLQLIESRSDRQLTQQRYLFDDLLFSFPFQRNGSLIQFQLTGDTFVTSSALLTPVSQAFADDLKIPDMYPILPTVTLNEENIYRIEKIYPIKANIKKSCPHTLFIHYDKEVVKNLYEEEVSENQLYGRSLLKAFTATASFARQKYGDEVKDLPVPVTLQIVQTDSQFFHFGVFQLNTLNLEEGSKKNIWYQTPLQYLFENCSYKVGRPTLDGYNVDVVKLLYSFYNNI